MDSGEFLLLVATSHVVTPIFEFLIIFGFWVFLLASLQGCYMLLQGCFHPSWTEPRIRLKCGKRQVQLLPEYFTKLKDLTSKDVNFHQDPGFCGIVATPRTQELAGRRKNHLLVTPVFFMVFCCFLPFRRKSQLTVSWGCFLAISQISHPTSSWERCHPCGAEKVWWESLREVFKFRLLGSTTIWAVLKTPVGCLI